MTITPIVIITAIASTATAIGVIIAVVQLWQSEKLAKTEFEDQFRRDYREICASLPVHVFLGHELPPEEIQQNLGTFHEYFHLCNSQIFLQKQGKISKSTWAIWARGIHANLALPAFLQAWNYIHSEANTHRLHHLSEFLENNPYSKTTGSH